ncbi:MAG: PIN domain-containing protein, partial [Phycisphaerales bacterium]
PGLRDRNEIKEFDKLTSQTRTLFPTDADWTLAMRLGRLHARSSGVDWVDCLVAATAMRLGVPVATINEKHFRPIRGLKVIRPY